MILIFLPTLIYSCSLLASLVLAIFLRRYLWRLCINKIVAFTVGAIVFLIASKLFSIIGSLILFLISRSIGPEASNFLGILGFSYGDYIIYFITITPALLACVTGYKYLSARIIHFSQTPETEVVTTKSLLFLRLATGTSILVFLWALFGSWGPLYRIVTVPVASNFPRLLATSLHQPRLCLFMPTESFNAEYDFRAIGMECLHDSQTQEEYYYHCDLIPISVRESEFSSLEVYRSISPYQECVTSYAKSLANDQTSSLSHEAKANTCNKIQNLARRAECLLPYISSSTWNTACNDAINDLKKTDDDHNAKDAVIIGKCLNKQTVNELNKNGTPMWFNYHILTGYNSYGIPLTSNSILSWLQSIGLDPKSTDATGKNFLSRLLNSHPESDFGKVINDYEMYNLLDHGLGIDAFTQKDKAGLSSVDYAFQYGHWKVLDNIKFLYPDLKRYTPSAILVTNFLKKCHDGGGDWLPKFSGQRGTAYDECFHSDDEQARQEFLKLGLLGVPAVTILANKVDISRSGPVDDNEIKSWFEKYTDTTINKFAWSPATKTTKQVTIFSGTQENFDKSTAKNRVVEVSGYKIVGATTYTYNNPAFFHQTDAVENSIASYFFDLRAKLTKREYLPPGSSSGSGNVQFDKESNRWYAPATLEKLNQHNWQFYLVTNGTISMVEVTGDVDPVPTRQCPSDQKNNSGTCDVNIGFHFEFFISDPISLDKIESK